MGVNPGFGGQTFIPETVDKIREIKKFHSKENFFEISVDGGINTHTAQQCSEAGADILIAGSSIFQSKNYKSAIGDLRDD